MVTLPAQPNDQFLAAADQIRGSGNQSISTGNSVNNVTRQAKIPNGRAGAPVRNMVRWLVPEVGIIEMYLNPNQIQYPYRKDIPTPQRTKGGFVITYWGEQLTTLSISGSTGSSGIEGINVLEEIYRAEQYAFDPYALAIASNNAKESEQDLVPAFLNSIGGSISDVFNSAMETGNPVPSRPAPTLASLAFSVEMYWSGWAFRGYFTDFTVTENAEKLGLFDYQMSFVATQRRGTRLNFLGWHRSAVNGPSNSNPVYGVPYSFSEFGNNGPLTNVPAQNNKSVSESAISLIIGQAGRSIF